MVEPFQDNADISGMSTQSDLHIDDVVHNAFVSVDEAGTEALAASAVIVGTTSMPPPPVAVTTILLDVDGRGEDSNLTNGILLMYTLCIVPV